MLTLPSIPLLKAILTIKTNIRQSILSNVYTYYIHITSVKNTLFPSLKLIIFYLVFVLFLVDFSLSIMSLSRENKLCDVQIITMHNKAIVCFNKQFLC